MKIHIVTLAFVVCYMVTLTYVDALGLLPVKLGAKLALPALALKLGLLGPLKIAVMSKAGLGLGIIGTVLGASALKLGLAGKEDNGYDSYGYDNYGYDSYSGYDSYRKKRSTLEGDSFSYIQKSDPTQCTERLLCELSMKSKSTENLSTEELAILSVVKYKPEGVQSSKAHASFENAIRYGYSTDNCQDIYPFCPYNAKEMMSLIKLLSSDLETESKDSLETLIRY